MDFEKALKTIIKEELRSNNPIPDLLSFLHIKKQAGKEYNDKLLSFYNEIKTDSKSLKPLLKKLKET